MLKPYIRQLKSQDPAERRDAIKKLARLHNEAAIPVLETVAQSDPDAELRELAQKAIRYIKQSTQETAAPAPKEEAQAAPPRFASNRYIPPREREAARKYVNAAFSYYQAGDRARAVEWLGKGLSLNPNLQKDSFVAGIIQSAMQMSVDEALPILTHPDRRKAYIAQLGGKQPIRAAHVPADATWGNVWVDFGLYGLVVAVSEFAMLYFAMDMVRDLVRRSPELANSPNTNALLNMSLSGMMLTSLLGGIYVVFGAALQGGFIHLAATFLLGGRGTLAYLYRKLLPLQTAFMLLIATTLVLLALLASPTVAMTLFNLVSFVSSFVIFYLTARVVAEVYGFGAWSGCGAIFLGSLLSVAVFFCGGYGLLIVLASLFGGA